MELKYVSWQPENIAPAAGLIGQAQAAGTSTTHTQAHTHQHLHTIWATITNHFDHNKMTNARKIWPCSHTLPTGYGYRILLQL